MPLTGIRAATGEVVEGFDLSAEQWAMMKAEPPGTYLIRRSRLPAILKSNNRRTRWFAARPGESNSNWKPTSPEHEFAQIRLVKALRAAGLQARLEEPGTTPAGEMWEADVYVEHGGRKIAIEVQMSSQTFAEYARRSSKYRDSNVKVAWLINSRHFKEFTLGCINSNMPTPSPIRGPLKNGEQFHREFPAFPISFNCPQGRPSDEATRVHVFRPPEGWPARELSLAEFAVGLVNGALTHAQQKYWVWKD